MTNLLQPADVSWFKPLKSHYHRLWNEWFLEGKHTYTRSDNARSPGYAKAIDWLSLMWNSISSHLIANSFECCGVVRQYNLHKALNHIIQTKTLINDYIDTASVSDDVDGFESDDDIFQEINEPHVTVIGRDNEIDNDSQIISSYQKTATNHIPPSTFQQNNTLSTFTYDTEGYSQQNPLLNQHHNLSLNQHQNLPRNQPFNTQFNPALNHQYNIQFNQQHNQQYHPLVNQQFNPALNHQFDQHLNHYNPQYNPQYNGQYNPPYNVQFNPQYSPQYNTQVCSQ